MTRKQPNTFREYAFAAALTVLVGSGCATVPKAILVESVSAPAWPRPPDVPRIRHLGEIRGESSLGRQPKGLEALRDLLAGPPPMTDFVAPTAVAVAGSRVYVADRSAPGGPAVQVLDLDARTFASWRAQGGPPLQWPVDLALADDRLAVADAAAARVFLFDLTGHCERTIGDGALQRPAAIAWKADARELWVVDSAQHACLVFCLDGSLKFRIGRRGAAAGEFNFPAGLCIVPQLSAIALADAMNFRVQLLSPDGAPLARFGRKGDAAGDFSLPRDLAADSDGHLYVLDTQFENAQLFDAAGRLLMAFGEEGRGPGQFNLPGGITIDERDRIWIADTYNRRVQVFQYLSEDGE